jgi:glycosyltransferase involved in cell wall biosynthesis
MHAIAPLGFAIPAYRRPELLDRALASIVPQARALDAPIYIPDDSCDQTNVAVIAKWRQAFPRVIHEINERNLGIDRNIDKAIVGCPATYVHVVGDDDVIFPGFAARVMSIIRGQAPGHIVCSYLYLSNDYRQITGQALIPPDAPATSLRQFLPAYGWALGFIGANVFRRERFATCGVDGFGTYFHHVVRLTSYLEPAEPLGFVAEPLVGNRADDESTATWSGDRLNVVFGLEKAFMSAMKGRYSQAEIDQTVAAARRCLGYAQSVRLLYWGALAERSGAGEQYWETLKLLLPRSRYERIRWVPAALYAPLLKLVPLARRTKRFARRLTARG